MWGYRHRKMHGLFPQIFCNKRPAIVFKEACQDRHELPKVLTSAIYAQGYLHILPILRGKVPGFVHWLR